MCFPDEVTNLSRGWSVARKPHWCLIRWDSHQLVSTLPPCQPDHMIHGIPLHLQGQR